MAVCEGTECFLASPEAFPENAHRFAKDGSPLTIFGPGFLSLLLDSDTLSGFDTRSHTETTESQDAQFL